MKKIMAIFLILLSFFLSCSPVVKILPEHVKKIYVKPFINSTSVVGLEVEFTNAVIDAMLKDGRVCLVNTEDESDEILSGEIIRYIKNKLFNFGDNKFNQYEIIIVANVYLIDKNRNKVLWTESNMSEIQMNLKDARDNIWEKFSRNIVKQTVKALY